MKITIRVRSDRARRALKESRRALRSDILDIAEEHGRTKVLPTARRLAPGIVASNLIVRRTAARVRLTTNARGMQRRILGYLNFGGTIGTQIKPKGGRTARSSGRPGALRLPDGRFVARIRTPRAFAGMHFMEQARDRHVQELRRRYQRDLPGIIQRRIKG